LSLLRSPCQCTEYLSRISDLEGRLSLLKRQAKSALDQAGKSYSLMRQVSALEDKVSGLVARLCTSRNVILILLRLSSQCASS
jgi:hypothetical protein